MSQDKTPRMNLLDNHIIWLKKLAENHKIIAKKVKEIIPKIEELRPSFELTLEIQQKEVAIQTVLVQIFGDLQKQKKLDQGTHLRIVKIMEDILTPLSFSYNHRY